MQKLIVLYDACVLYPAPLRDLLMHLAMAQFIKQNGPMKFMMSG